MAEDGIEVNTVQFEGAMQALKRAVREGMIDASFGTLPVQARLLAQRCQQLTPPENQGQGYAAVTRDLTRIYFPQSESAYSSKSLKKIIRTDDRAAWNAASQRFSGSHGLRNTVAIGFTEGLHQQNRDKFGRGRRVKYANIGFVTLGPQAHAARDYVTKIKARVGWAKGGWNAGVMLLGGNGSVKASWVARHGNARGSVVDGRNDADPYIGVINDTGWAKNNRGNAERVVKLAIAGRIRDMYNYADGKCRNAVSGVMEARGGFGGMSNAA